MSDFVRMITIPEEVYEKLLAGKPHISQETVDPLAATSQQYELLKYNRNRRLDNDAVIEKPINVIVKNEKGVNDETGLSETAPLSPEKTVSLPADNVSQEPAKIHNISIPDALVPVLKNDEIVKHVISNDSTRLYPVDANVNDRRLFMETVLAKIVRDKEHFGVASDLSILKDDSTDAFRNSNLNNCLEFLYQTVPVLRAPAGALALKKRLLQNLTKKPQLGEGLAKKKKIKVPVLYQLCDPSNPAGFASRAKLLKEARRYNKEVTVQDVDDFLKGQHAYTLHKQARYKFPRLKTTTSGLHVDWQADLAMMDKLSAVNDGNNYILVCIDVLSRKIMAIPVRTKDEKATKTARLGKRVKVIAQITLAITAFITILWSRTTVGDETLAYFIPNFKFKHAIVIKQPMRLM
uniref:Integrase catalytic domain-containing protein n=1 Tax=Panagrellus redivivus TaxID=6233 RepID=A0A7E4UZT7_PANRE